MSAYNGEDGGKTPGTVKVFPLNLIVFTFYPYALALFSQSTGFWGNSGMDILITSVPGVC